MAFNELKKILVGKITETNDEELLKVVYRLLDNPKGVYQLSAEELSAVHEARNNIKPGNL